MVNRASWVVARAGGGADVALGGVEAVVHVRVVVDVAAAQVVGDVAAAVVVVRVVDHPVHFAGHVAAGVDDIQIADASGERPSAEAELVAVEVRLKRCGSVLLRQTGIREERAFGFQRLRGVLHQRLPVAADAVGGADATAAVGGVVPVILHQAVVARGGDGVGPRLSRGALFRGARRHGRAETGGVVAIHHHAARREGGRHVVHPAALIVAVDHGAQGEVVRDRHVHIALGAGAVRAAAGEAVAGVEAGLELRRIGFARDEAQVAGLRAGAEQRALRPGKHLDAFDVRGVHVQVAAAERHRLLVHVQRDARRRALGGGEGDAGLLGGAAADVELFLARAVAGRDHVGQVVHVLVEGFHRQVAEAVAGERLHDDGDVLRALGALGGGDDDLLDLSGACGRGDRNRGGDGGGEFGPAPARGWRPVPPTFAFNACHRQVAP